MLRLFRPDYYVDSFTNVTLEMLKELKIDGLLIDVDNTLAAWNSMLVDEKVVEHVFLLKQNGVKICLISNNDSARVIPVANLLEVPFISEAKKPLAASFIKGAALLQLPSDRVGIVGDQLMTDMLGGGRAGLKRILVTPLPGREFFGTKFNRFMEKIIMDITGIKKTSS